MASRSLKLIAASALVVLGVGGYFVYSSFAAQGQGRLAQAPLNNQIQVPPAFIMAVDDSNSMVFERIFPGGDGRLQWNSANDSFFNNNGEFFSNGQGCGYINNQANRPTYDCYLYLFPHDSYNAAYGNGGRNPDYAYAIPPLDAFGFARSPEYNASYFNPGLTYEPWMHSNGTLWPNADPRSARADPRDPNTYGDSFKRLYDVKYNLTSNRAESSEEFSMLNGMRIPNLSGRGMSYRGCTGTNWRGQCNAWGWVTSAVNISSNQYLAFNYFPATFYLRAGDPAPSGYRVADNYRPIVNDACGPGCNMRRYEIKPANYQTTEAYNAAIQNFANWFQYHRNRLLAMVGAMSHAMTDVNNMSVGYFTINNRVDVTMRNVDTQRSGLYSELYRLQAGALVGAGGGTPNRWAVQHLGEQFRRTGADAPIQSACQRNGGMLFTDGFTNRHTTTGSSPNPSPSGIGNIDEDLDAPFADDFSHTLADIAAQYYLSEDQVSGSNSTFVPLRTGTGFPSGQVPVPDACNADDPDPRLNCQRDLHMNFYGITLGATGAIYGVDAAATADPFANHPNWDAAGNPRDSDGPPTIDEIWHATINTRGEFVNAETPADITAAMRRVLSAVQAGASPSGSVALTGERVGNRSLYVTPRYEVRNEGTDWFSTLEAFKVTADEETREVTEERLWEASARLPDVSARGDNVWFERPGGNVERFRVSNSNITWELLCANERSVCSPADAQGLGVGIGEAILYLLGDVSGEVRNGGVLRDRGSRLGNIINSTPVVSAPNDDYGYRWLPGVGESYADYLDNKLQNRNTMIYVGANAGMLHAFDSGMNAEGEMVGSTSSRGREAFAYIPRTAVGHMGNLLFPYRMEDKENQKFQHRYYVDGPVVVSDAHYSGSWKTVLVGTAGAGGRSIFSLDVSNPSGFTANSRLWEINDSHSNDDIADNIGHVLGRPLIVPVKNTQGDVRWKAIFGNGYESENGKAVLFVVDVHDSSVVHMITADEGTTTPSISGDNGLGNLIAVDRWGGDDLDYRIRDGYADTVYAADQRGALWKFDLRGISSSGVTTSTVTTPLFVTQTSTDDGQRYRQPILGGLTAVAGPGGSLMILFGTGSFSFVGDSSDSSQQTLYGVLDIGDGQTVGLSNLHQRTIESTGVGVRTISGGVAAIGSRGWYLNLPRGERFVAYPSILSGVVLMPTYAPVSLDDGGCSTAGLNWLFGLDARTGNPAMSDVSFGSPDGATGGEGVGAMAVDSGGTAPIRNVETMVIPPAGFPEPELCDPSDPTCDEDDPLEDPPDPSDVRCYARGIMSGVPPMYRNYFCGRMSWRQIQ